MAGHAFVDESKRGPYVMCVYVTEPVHRGEVTKTLRGLRAAGASRLHMKNESGPRRKAVLSALLELGVTASVFTSTSSPQRAARARIIGDGIWPRVLRDKVQRLIFEAEAGQDERDRAQLYQLTRAAKLDGFVYEHRRPTDEPMLWVPDAIAWAYGAGGEWRRRCAQLVTDVQDCDRL